MVLSFCRPLKLYSRPDERPAEFRARLQLRAREERDLEKAKIQQRIQSRIDTLKERVRRAEQRVDKERQQASSATTSAALSFGTSLVGALFGRKKLSATNASRAATSMRAANRALEQRKDIQRAEDNVQSLAQEIAALNDELQVQLNDIGERFAAAELELEEYLVTPRKSDLIIEEVSLIWLPYRAGSDGALSPAFDADLFVSPSVD